MRARPRKLKTGTAAAFAAGILAVLALPAGAGQEDAGLHPALSGNNAEDRATIPISKHRGAEPEVAVSIPLASPKTLQAGDVIRVSAELQVTTTCVDSSDRCIGKPYSYTPLIESRLVLAKGRERTEGRKLTSFRRIECNQRRPNRNHHCVFVFSNIDERIRNAGNLPCPPNRCFVNLVTRASHRRTRPGSVIVLGADRPDGSIGQDKARLDVVVQRGKAGLQVSRTRDEARRSVPIEPGGSRGRRVIYSLRLDGLRRGDVLLVKARALTGIGGLPYNVFVGTRLVAASSPTDTRPKGIARRAIAIGGQVGELNGFNCTHGPSQYRNPCETRKAGTTVVRRTPTRAGKPAPIYLNLVGSALEKLANAGPGDRMQVLDGGYLRVSRYRAD